MNLTEYIREKIKIVVLEGGHPYFYTGEILEEDADSIKFKDKFQNIFVFAKSTITKVEVLNHE